MYQAIATLCKTLSGAGIVFGLMFYHRGNLTGCIVAVVVSLALFLFGRFLREVIDRVIYTVGYETGYINAEVKTAARLAQRKADEAGAQEVE